MLEISFPVFRTAPNAVRGSRFEEGLFRDRTILEINPSSSIPKVPALLMPLWSNGTPIVILDLNGCAMETPDQVRGLGN
jgi:hypothetical protein